MGIGALNYQGVKGGLKLNDVIEEFKYVYKDKTIKAGDFVNYINGVAGETTETTIETHTTTAQQIHASAGYTMVAVTLKEDVAFLVYGISGTIYGTVCTLDKQNVVYSTVVTISSKARPQTGSGIVLTKIMEEKVMVSYTYDSSSNYKNYALCSISDNVINVLSTDNTLISIETDFSTDLLTEGNIVLTYCSGSYLMGKVGVVGDTSISWGSATQLISTSSTITDYGFPVTALPDNEFLSMGHDNNSNLNGVVCSVSGTTITVKISKSSLLSGYILNPRSLLYLSDNKVLCLHAVNSQTGHKACILKIGTTTISTGTVCGMGGTYAGTTTMHSSYLASDKALVAYGGNGGNYARILSISGTTITLGTQYSSNTDGIYFSITVLSEDKALFVFGDYSSTSSYKAYVHLLGISDTTLSTTVNISVTTTTVEYETQVTLSTEPPFDGIALSSGVGGDDTEHNEQVKIARPLYIDNLVRNGDFSNSLEGWTDLNLNTSYPISWSINNDGLKFITNSNWTGIKTGKEQIIKSQIPAGHLFYASMSIKGSFSSNHSVVLAVSNGDYAHSVNVTNVSSTPSKVSLRYNSTYLYDRVQIWVRSVKSGDTATITDIKCYDLTAIFGKGNEPTKEWCDNNL